MKKAQRQEDRMQRGAGILLSITSLPSPHGIGTIGREAYDFVDLLAEMKQSYWQVLPLGPTGYGDSPYQSFSAFAGNPYLIDLDELVRQGLLTEEEAGSADGETGSLKISEAEAGTLEKPVDYGHLYQTRFQILRKAFVRFHTEKKEYRSFCDENREWLDDYVLYMVIKNRENGKPWYEWEEPLKQRKEKALQKIRKEEQENCEFYCFLQYEFFRAWTDLKAYANGNLFNPEDMDNADIISMVENSPTYLRDKSTLNSIKMKAEQEGQLATEAAQEAEGGAGGVITF